MEMENLRKLRLLLEDFPKNHNLILIGQVELLSSLDLTINQDLKSRITYSVVTRRLHDDVMREFVHRELDRLGLAHSTFTSGATELTHSLGRWSASSLPQPLLVSDARSGPGLCRTNDRHRRCQSRLAPAALAKPSRSDRFVTGLALIALSASFGPSCYRNWGRLLHQ